MNAASIDFRLPGTANRNRSQKGPAMTDAQVLDRSTIHVGTADVTLLTATFPGVAGPVLIEAVSDDGRRVVITTPEHDPERVAEAVEHVAGRTYPSASDAPCHGCSAPLRRTYERSLMVGPALVWTDDVTGGWVCPDTGDEHDPQHRHVYRADVSDWWCETCGTVTDFCQQTNPR